MRNKKILFLIITVCLALLFCVIFSACGDSAIGGKKIVYVGIDETNTFTYSSKNGEVTITGLSEDGKILAVLTIPREIFSEPVVAIADRAFENNKIIAAVSYEESSESGSLGNLKTIGVCAFEGCVKLESFVVPASLETIGSGAFNGCTSLASFTFMPVAVDPSENEQTDEQTEETDGEQTEEDNASETAFVSGDNLVSIGDNAFSKSLIGSFYFGNSFKSLGNNVFTDCNLLASFSIHSSQQNFSIIGGALYSYDNKILYKLPSKFNLSDGKFKSPEALEVIADKAFQSNTTLVSVDFKGANSLSVIGSYAFQDCASLNSIYIYTAPAVGTNILIHCNRLAAIVYSGKQKIMDLFDGTVEGISSNLSSVTFNGESSTIVPRALEGCDAVATITIYSGVSEIGEGAFDGLKSIGNFRTTENHPNFSYDENGILYSADKKILYAYPSGKTEKNFSVPTTVTTIGAYAFNSAYSLTSVNLGGTSSAIEEINAYAFKNCINLTTIAIPEKVASIKEGVFSGCKKLLNFSAPAAENVPAFFFEGCEVLPTATLTGVKSIGDGAYKGCLALTSVTFDAVVESIGSYAFEGCAALQTITFNGTEEAPSALNTIGNGAFSGCAVLQNPTLPKNVETVGAFAFSDCNALTQIILPEGILAVRNNAFANCKGLLNLVIPKTATLVGSSIIKGADAIVSVTAPLSYPYKEKTSGYFAYYFGGESYLESSAVPATLKKITVSAASEISDYAFADMRSVTEIVLPVDSLKIGKKAFVGCVSLKLLTLPERLASIGERSFENCISLENIDVPASLKTLGEGAFYACEKLKAIELPSQIYSIPDSAFAGCKGMLNIALPSSLKTVGKSAFSETESLEGIYLHSTINSIGEWAFHKSGLTSVALPENLPQINDFTFYDCRNLESVIINEKTTKIGLGAFLDCVSLKSVNLPIDLVSFAERAFMNCSSLERIAIPEAVTEIPLRAFTGCSSLLSVNLTNTAVTVINEKAFLNCVKLRNIVFSDGLSTIGKEAFLGCSKLISVEITRNVIAIGSSAFANCSEIKYAIFKTNEVPITAVSVFENVPQEFRIYVPSALYNGFVESDVWGTYAGVIINSTTVYNNEFSYQTLKDGSIELLQYIGVGGNVEVPAVIDGKTVSSIAPYAFFNCVNIQEVIFPDSVTKIGSYAFSGCSLLDTVSIGTEGVASSIKEIGEGVFINCTSLMLIKIYAASAPTLGGNGFENVPASLAIRVPSSSVSLFVTANKWKNYASNISSL